jgi:hypothetical protein
MVERFEVLRRVAMVFVLPCGVVLTGAERWDDVAVGEEMILWQIGEMGTGRSGCKLGEARRAARCQHLLIGHRWAPAKQLTARAFVRCLCRGIPGVHEAVWSLSLLSFYFLYPSTFNILEVRCGSSCTDAIC